MLEVRFFGVIFMAMLVVITGCGTVRHKLDFQEGYKPQQGTKIEVSSVINETGETFDIDIEVMLREAITEALQNENLLCTRNEEQKLILISKIVDYQKGDAFKRWLMPGWGATELTIQCDLKDGDKVVGSAKAKRTVSFGGAYTIGAWKTIFASIAKDIVKDLRKQIQE